MLTLVDSPTVSGSWWNSIPRQSPKIFSVLT